MAGPSCPVSNPDQNSFTICKQSEGKSQFPITGLGLWFRLNKGSQVAQQISQLKWSVIMSRLTLYAAASPAGWSSSWFMFQSRLTCHYSTTCSRGSWRTRHKLYVDEPQRSCRRTYVYCTSDNVKAVALKEKEQKSEWYLKINPNGVSTRCSQRKKSYSHLICTQVVCLLSLTTPETILSYGNLPPFCFVRIQFRIVSSSLSGWSPIYLRYRRVLRYRTQNLLWSS